MEALAEQLTGKIGLVDERGLSVTITFMRRQIEPPSKGEIA
jgi:two-component sensor histidine kinase